MTTNEDRIRSYFAACSSGSSSEVASHFTEDAVIYDTNHPPIMSAEAIGDFGRKFATNGRERAGSLRGWYRAVRLPLLSGAWME